MAALARGDIAALARGGIGAATTARWSANPWLASRSPSPFLIGGRFGAAGTTLLAGLPHAPVRP